ncbi:MAG TPA: PA domain-containing protein, partial [Bryobacteraceae bacterium]
MRFSLLALLAGGLCAASLSPTEYLGYVKYLASEDMRGRATGSPELEKAAAFIRDQFRSLKLQPLSGDSYYQDFEVTTSAKLGNQNEITFSSGAKKETLRFNEDFVPFNLSAAGKVSGEVVFAGFGISAPEYHYDDYAGLDVKDKIVILLRHEPQEFDDKSVFDGKVYTAHAQLFSKATNAKLHGAKAVLLVNDVGAHPNDADVMEKFGGTAGPANAGIEFIQVKAAVVNYWLKPTGKTLSSIEA